jgi:hypothetical protein
MKSATVAAVCAALMVISGCAQPKSGEPPQPGKSTSGVSVNFGALAPDAAGIRFSDGQQAVLSVATPASSVPLVQDGALTFIPQTDTQASAFIGTPDLGAPVTTLEAQWAFGAAQGGALAINVSKGWDAGTGTPVLPYAFRFVATEASWYIAVWGAQDAKESIITTGEFHPPLPNAAALSAKFWIVDNWVTAKLPNGQLVSATDARVSGWKGNFADIELHTNNGGAQAAPRVKSFAVGTAPELPPPSSR